jgi:hypothetical protein
MGNPMQAAVSHHDADDEAAFALPMYGLFADLEARKGFVQLADDFHSAPAATQLQILAGWRRDLDEQWRLSLVKLFQESSAATDTASLDKRLAGFRARCDSLGIACPADLDRLLA